MTTSSAVEPEWLADWQTAWPRPEGAWTLFSAPDRWGTVIPENGRPTPVVPASDESLPALAEVIERGDLVSYRAGRRAVVRTPTGWIKVVRPKRLDATVTPFRRLGVVADLGVRVPRVVSSDPSGWFELSHVGGISLHRAIMNRGADSSGLEAELHATARALAELHDAAIGESTAGAEIAPYVADDPHRWVGIVGRALPELGRGLIRVADLLPAVDLSGDAVLHTDLHDKNIIIGQTDGPADGAQPGLVDLDGLRTGCREVDVANLAVHLELRAMQLGVGVQVADRWSTSLRAACRQFGELDSTKLAAIEAHTWFRLSCLYRFRRSGNRLANAMLTRCEVGLAD